MVKFLTTRGAAYEIENIITNAKRWLVLISPYVKVPEPILQSLKDAGRRNVNITLVYGKGELKPDVRTQLGQLRNLSLLYLDNLHAKCFFNEESMVITSLNLLDSSEQKNREMGILISVTEDRDVYTDAVKEAKLIVDSSTKDSADVVKKRPSAQPKKTPKKGFCIRCRIPIPHNEERPFCIDCYEEWSEWGNPHYEEYYCHTCGIPEITTKLKPQCYLCYSNSHR